MFVKTKKKQNTSKFRRTKKTEPQDFLHTRVIGTSLALRAAPRQNGGGFRSVHRFGLIVEGK